VEERAVCPL